MSYKIKAFANDAVSAIDTRSLAEIVRDANITRGKVMAEMFSSAVDFVRKTRAGRSFTENAVSAIDTRNEAEIIRKAEIMRGEVVAQMFDRVVDFVRNVRTNIRQAFEQARTMRELAALDDRSLADIGLARSDIPAFAMRAVRTDAMGAVRTEAAQTIETAVQEEQPRIAA